MKGLKVLVLAIVVRCVKFVNSFKLCEKEKMGYRCKHGNHNGIKECDGSRIKS